MPKVIQAISRWASTTRELITVVMGSTMILESQRSRLRETASERIAASIAVWFFKKFMFSCFSIYPTSSFFSDVVFDILKFLLFCTELGPGCHRGWIVEGRLSIHFRSLSLESQPPSCQYVLKRVPEKSLWMQAIFNTSWACLYNINASVCGQCVAAPPVTTTCTLGDRKSSILLFWLFVISWFQLASMCAYQCHFCKNPSHVT